MLPFAVPSPLPSMGPLAFSVALAPPSLLVGLAAGLLATALMTLVELPVYRRFGMEAVLEFHENMATLAKWTGRPAADHFLEALPLHFLHGGVGGLVLAAALNWVPGLFALTATRVLGWLFGLLLWLVTLAIHRPITGVSAVRHPRGPWPALLSLATHSVYGVALGVFIRLLSVL